MVLLHVIAAPGAVDPAGDAPARRRPGDDVHHLAALVPDVLDGETGQGPAVGRLASALRVERGAVEEDGGLPPLERPDGDDLGLEVEEAGVGQVQALRHPASVARDAAACRRPSGSAARVSKRGLTDAGPPSAATGPSSTNDGV